MVGDAATLKVELEEQKRALVSPVESAVKVAPGGIHINVNAVKAGAECDVLGGEFIIKRRRLNRRDSQKISDCQPFWKPMRPVSTSGCCRKVS